MRRSKKDPGSPKMLSLNIGENDPVGNRMVAMEMDEVARMKFKKTKDSRKRSIHKIFGDMVKIDTDNRVCDRKARMIMKNKAPAPRRSMMPKGAGGIVLDHGPAGEPAREITMKSVWPRKASLMPNVVDCAREFDITPRAILDDGTDSTICEDDVTASSLSDE